jgi:hypothetical protein
MVYEYSDGSRGVREISEMTGGQEYRLDVVERVGRFRLDRTGKNSQGQASEAGITGGRGNRDTTLTSKGGAMSQATASDKDKRLFDVLDEVKRLTKMETDLLRVLVHHKSDRVVSIVLPSEKERLAYQHSDGKRSSRQVGDIAGVSHTAVGRWWKDWKDKGTGESVSVQGGGQRFKAKYTLLELAVAILEGEVRPG